MTKDSGNKKKIMVEVSNKEHRNRVKQRFLKEGLDNFDQIHALELLLFYCIPRKDTKVLAKTLINHFGSLSNVLRATPEELKKVSGVGEQTATFLSFMGAFVRYDQILSKSEDTLPKLDSVEACGGYLLRHFTLRRNETVLLLCLDSKCKLICCRQIGEGSINSASVSVRRIVEEAIGVNASVVVLAHNHPGGVAIPSGDDVMTTRRVARALKAVEITLWDHIVVADNDFVSLLQSGLYNPNENYA